MPLTQPPGCATHLRNGVLPPAALLFLLQRASEVLRWTSRRLALGLFLRLWRQRRAVVDVQGLRGAAPDGLHWCDGREQQPWSDKRPLGSFPNQAACPRPGVTVGSVVYRHLYRLESGTRGRKRLSRPAAAGVSYAPRAHTLVLTPTPSCSHHAALKACATEACVAKQAVLRVRCDSCLFRHWSASY